MHIMHVTTTGRYSANCVHFNFINFYADGDLISVREHWHTVNSLTQAHLSITSLRLTASCHVCSAPAAQHLHYGAICCYRFN